MREFLCNSQVEKTNRNFFRFPLHESKIVKSDGDKLKSIKVCKIFYFDENMYLKNCLFIFVCILNFNFKIHLKQKSDIIWKFCF